jgi:hypothetical protein
MQWCIFLMKQSKWGRFLLISFVQFFHKICITLSSDRFFILKIMNKDYSMWVPKTVAITLLADAPLPYLELVPLFLSIDQTVVLSQDFMQNITYTFRTNAYGPCSLLHFLSAACQNDFVDFFYHPWRSHLK